MRTLIYCLAGILYVGMPVRILAQNPSRAATVREYKQAFSTLPYFDADPVAAPAGVYPYPRYHGFGGTPIQKEWTVVELENDWLKVTILPELGGRIWSAVEKRTGQPFIFQNDRLHFAEGSARGPWVGGGISLYHGEHGAVGLNSAPVNYAGGRRSDGIAYCIMDFFDLLTRTHVGISVEMPSDKAYFITRTTWHNGTSYALPLRRWTEVTLPAGEPAQYTPSLPADASAPRVNIPLRQSPTSTSGVYWPAKGLGWGHYAEPRAGEQTWLSQAPNQAGYWTLQQGLLSTTTDSAAFLLPYATQEWTDIWFPVLQTGGIEAVSPIGTLAASLVDGQIKASFCALQAVQDTLRIRQRGRVVASALVTQAPLETRTYTFPWVGALSEITVDIGGNLVWSQKEEGLSPTSTPAAPISNVATLRAAQQWVYRGRPAQALPLLENALRENPQDAALQYAYGLAQYSLGKQDFAKKAYLAALPSETWKTAASLGLAKIAVRERDWQRAVDYAVQAGAPRNPTARWVRAIAMRALNPGKFGAYSPVQYPFSLADWLESNSQMKPLLRDEYPAEHYLEAAAFYADLGLPADAERTLQYAPEGAEKHFWLAWLAHLQQHSASAEEHLDKALRWSPYLVFPFRTETLLPLQWAYMQKRHWKIYYYMALLHQHLGNTEDAKGGWTGAGTSADYAPLHLGRARAFAQGRSDYLQWDAAPGVKRIPNHRLEDLQRARRFDPQGWRPLQALAEYHLYQGDVAQAPSILDTALRQFPRASLWALRLRAAHRLGKGAEALKQLEQNCPPIQQNRTELQQAVEVVVLSAALTAIKQKKWTVASQALAGFQSGPLARCLSTEGNGSPAAQYVEGLLNEAQGQRAAAKASWQKIHAYTPTDADWYIHYLAYLRVGQPEIAKKMLEERKKGPVQDPMAWWIQHKQVPKSNDWAFFLSQLP